MGGVIEFGVALAANTQTNVNMASSDGRDAAIQYGQAAIGTARVRSNMADTMRANASVLSGLILSTEDR
jgi:hypothetical protein